MEVDLGRPVLRPDGAPPRAASLVMLGKLRIPEEVDLQGWDPEEPDQDVDLYRSSQGISTRWECFACSDSKYVADRRRGYESEVRPWTVGMVVPLALHFMRFLDAV